ncbi:hypothetical protein ACNO5E_13400 [Vibrio parahaemolyticus]
MAKSTKDVLIDGKPADHLTYEHRDSRICVHAWGTYSSDSVLAGQPLKKFVDSFETVEEAIAEYPDAESSNPLIQPQNTFDHLPDDADY